HPGPPRTAAALLSRAGSRAWVIGGLLSWVRGGAILGLLGVPAGAAAGRPARAGGAWSQWAGGAAGRLLLIPAGIGDRGGHRGHLLPAVRWRLVYDHGI